MAADLAGLTASGFLLAKTGSAWSVAPYLLASPIVHLGHGNPGGAAGGLALNFAAPVLLGVIFASGSDNGLEAIANAGLGIVVGVITATAVDAGLLARVTTPRPRQALLIPVVSAGPAGQRSFGVAATF